MRGRILCIIQVVQNASAGTCETGNTHLPVRVGRRIVGLVVSGDLLDVHRRRKFVKGKVLRIDDADALEVQPKLLRVLQEHEFERLGSTRTQQVDVRVVAATHRNLKQMVADGQFRSDLYYRLHVFPLPVPPLRKRREDIPLLVRHFVDEYSRRMNRRIETIPPQAMDALTGYSWPGNVRELQKVSCGHLFLS